MRNFFMRLLSERTALRSELEMVWETRRYCATREEEINARIKALDARDLNRALPARAARGW